MSDALITVLTLLVLGFGWWRWIYPAISVWVLSGIDWSGPLTHPWRTPSMAELGARLGEAIGRTAQAFGQLGTAYMSALGAFSSAYAAYRDGGVEEAEEHANESTS